MSTQTQTPAALPADDLVTPARITSFWKAVIIVLTVFGVLVAMNHVFFWDPFGFVVLPNAFLFLMAAAFLPMVFIIFPAKKGSEGSPVYMTDALVAGFVFVACMWFAVNAETILNDGWDRSLTYPVLTLVFSFGLWLCVLDALRRTAGLIVTVIAFVFSVYPMFAMAMPFPVLQGIQFGLLDTARIHVMGSDGIFGLPLQTAASVLIGFLIFGAALRYFGAAEFFYDLSRALFGRFRGGPAKVSIVSSATLGMMSGSAVSNVMTTGPMTIPAMRRAGFPGKYAAGIEASASTGGTITPPIMGTAAFLMVAFVGVPYSEIILAAAIPAFLYYLGSLVQVDAYAAKAGLKGESRSVLPRARLVLKNGWPYVLAFVGLIGLLMVTSEAQAPYWVVGALMVIALFFGEQRLTVKSFFEFIYLSGRSIAEIFGIIAGVGLIVGGLSMTGVSLSLARELIALVGDNLILILIAGAMVSFVMGMGMTVSAVYVFLAIVMTPALVALGVNPIAAHLFVIYWATVSYITPPVALAAFAAANIAKTPPMTTAFTAMRLGAVKYIVPFAFVFNPALLFQESSLWEVAYTFAFAAIGVFFLGCAFEGWATGVNRRMNVVTRILLGIGGVLTLAPELISSIVGLALSLGTLALCRVWNDGGPEKSAATEARRRELEAAEERQDDVRSNWHEGPAPGGLLPTTLTVPRDRAPNPEPIETGSGEAVR